MKHNIARTVQRHIVTLIPLLSLSVVNVSLSVIMGVRSKSFFELGSYVL